MIDLLFRKRSRELFTFTSDFVEWRSKALWVLERRRTRKSRSMCCEGSFGDSRWEWEWVTEWHDWRSLGASPLSRSAVFFATPWHYRESSDERYADHILFKYWLLRRLTPGITDRSPSVLLRQQSVSSRSSTTQLPRRVRCSAPAACRKLRLFLFGWKSGLYAML